MGNTALMALAKQKSANVSHLRSQEIRDERVRRTRARIDSGFVQLLHRRRYGDIRISDICKKAAVGRATFYAHYATKDDLLRSQFERIVAPMLIIKPNSPCVIYATPFFGHIQQMPDIFGAFMGPRGGTAPLVLRECFEARARQAIDLDRLTGLRKSALARFIAATLLTVIECWLENGSRETPNELQDLFSSLITPAIVSANR